jgi:hypothetical protein
MNTEKAMKTSKSVKTRAAGSAKRTAKTSSAAKTTKVAKVVRANKKAKVAKVVKAPKSVSLASSSLQSKQQQEVMKILKALKGWGSIEIKVVVPVQTHRATIESIGLDPVEAQPRQAYFFDTPDFALNKAGLVVRARRIQGGGADTVVKLRPVDPATISPALRRSASFKVELDAMPGGFVCSGSLKGTCTGEEVLAATSGSAPLSSLFSKEQLAFFKEHAPKGISMESLVILGPTYLLKAKHNPKSFGRRIVIEMWLYPDGSRILEISTKCLPEEAFQTGVEFKAYLANCGITVGLTDATKTKSAMEYFRERLESRAGAG